MKRSLLVIAVGLVVLDAVLLLTLLKDWPDDDDSE